MLLFKNIEELTYAEMAVFNYVKLHLNKVTNMSIQELAKCSNVSVATVARFCKKLVTQVTPTLNIIYLIEKKTRYL